MTPEQIKFLKDSAAGLEDSSRRFFDSAANIPHHLDPLRRKEFRYLQLASTAKAKAGALRQAIKDAEELSRLSRESDEFATLLLTVRKTLVAFDGHTFKSLAHIDAMRSLHAQASHALKVQKEHKGGTDASNTPS